MRLYLFELEKIMKKPLHFAAVSGCAVFTFVLWWMYADQADYSMGEGCLLYTSTLNKYRWDIEIKDEDL